MSEDSFYKKLSELLNQYSKENGSNTPDFILAQYLSGCLAVFNTAVQHRETWYGRDARPSHNQPTASDGEPVADSYLCSHGNQSQMCPYCNH